MHRLRPRSARRLFRAEAACLAARRRGQTVSAAVAALSGRVRVGAVLIGLALVAGALRGAIGPAAVRAATNANCAGTSTGLIPLDALGAARYQGFVGGLYGQGLNAPPAGHAALAAARGAQIVPRGAGGAPAADGKVVLLSLGMSNATQEFSAFVQRTQGIGGLSPRLVIVDGAQGGQTAAIIKDGAANFWKVVEGRLQAAGVTAAQVQALWIKEADAGPRAGFPAYAQTLADELGDVVRLAATRFPNVQLAYFSSRTYGGYASTTLNPEPYAYESAFSVQWLVRRQIDGDAALNADAAAGAVVAPALLWGPYLWADGLRARADGLWYACADFVDDGTHPSPAGGRPKVAALLDDFFRRDPTSRPWFVADPAAPPPPPLVWPPAPTPAPTPGPTATPGGATATAPATRPTPPPTTPGTPLSFRVHERPSGDVIWIVTAADLIVRRLRMLDGSRAAWLCGTVAPKSGWETGFTLEEPGQTLDLAAPPAERRSTIALIRGDLTALTGAVRCIQIDLVTDESPRWPPGVPPRETATEAASTPESGATATAAPSPSATHGNPPTPAASPTTADKPGPAARVFLPIGRRD